VKVSFCELGSNGKGNKAKNPAKHNYVSKVLVVVTMVSLLQAAVVLPISRVVT
jgi:hypothetical protein